MTSPGLVPTRRAVHRIAAHVLGRRRYQVAGRFGLPNRPARRDMFRTERRLGLGQES